MPGFARWARKEKVSDEIVLQAAREVVDGNVEADLGDWLFKKRLARPGSGKSGGFRIVVGYRKKDSDRVVFLFGFAKNEASTITDDGHEIFARLARSYIEATDEMIKDMVLAGEILEVKNDEGPGGQDQEGGA